MKKRLIIVSLSLLAAVGVVLIMVPMLCVDRTPAWAEDCGRFLYSVGQALREYSLAHKGNMPSKLALLYPEYAYDKRVLEQTPSFGTKNTRMALIYWHPSRLGSAHAPIAQLVLDPSLKTGYPWRSVVLWGDGHVRLHKGG